MKYTERQALRVFEEDHLRIDDSFKKRLRKQLVQAGQPAASKQRRLGLRIPAVVSWAALCFVIAGVAVWGLGGSHAPRVHAIDAMRLISEVNRQHQDFDPRTYSFVSYEVQRDHGPAANRCREDTPERAEVFYEETSKSYAYRKPDGSMEARYWHVSNEYNTQHESYYGPARSSVTHSPEKIAMPLSKSTYRADGIVKPTYFIVDRKGNRLPSYDIPKQHWDGRDVYAFYFRYDPLVVDAQCKDEIMSFVIDAQTYAILENDIFVGEVARGNLVIRNHAKVSYSNPNEAKALSIMETAGFDMEEAIKNGKADRYE